MVEIEALLTGMIATGATQIFWCNNLFVAVPVFFVIWSDSGLRPPKMQMLIRTGSYIRVCIYVLIHARIFRLDQIQYNWKHNFLWINIYLLIVIHTHVQLNWLFPFFLAQSAYQLVVLTHDSLNQLLFINCNAYTCYCHKLRTTHAVLLR